jgi:hypothetical protein
MFSLLCFTHGYIRKRYLKAVQLSRFCSALVAFDLRICSAYKHATAYSGDISFGSIGLCR